MAEPLLRVEDLSTHFFTSQGVVKAVTDVTYDIQPGETLGLVGESGSGKSVSALSLMRLIPNPPGKIVAGEVWFGGENILEVSDQRIREIRGNEIAMVFQEPMTSLNPVLTIGRQLTEALQLHLHMNNSQANERAVELLHMVGIPAADERLFDYPHQFSGGMRQRVMIAMALSCDPKLLLADEPTTALDVTIQAQVLEVMARLSRELGTAVVVITHNLGVVARYADRVNVMYGGRIVEMGPADEIYHAPQHAYTLGLLESVPRLDAREGRLLPIEGAPPDLTNLPPGCSFAPRCRFATDQCRAERPELIEMSKDHKVACWESEAVLAEARAKVLSALAVEE
ncbi:MAG TPA: ABC transporter ATP-binding protein [Dehalococcoidia bacterium]|nr:ABC transporter ATP-binding protein [Dehalococcoidia bacterium]